MHDDRDNDRSSDDDRTYGHHSYLDGDRANRPDNYHHHGDVSGDCCGQIYDDHEDCEACMDDCDNHSDNDRGSHDNQRPGKSYPEHRSPHAARSQEITPEHTRHRQPGEPGSHGSRQGDDHSHNDRDGGHVHQRPGASYPEQRSPHPTRSQGVTHSLTQYRQPGQPRSHGSGQGDDHSYNDRDRSQNYPQHRSQGTTHRHTQHQQPGRAGTQESSHGDDRSHNDRDSSQNHPERRSQGITHGHTQHRQPGRAGSQGSSHGDPQQGNVHPKKAQESKQNERSRCEIKCRKDEIFCFAELRCVSKSYKRCNFKSIIKWMNSSNDANP